MKRIILTFLPFVVILSGCTTQPTRQEPPSQQERPTQQEQPMQSSKTVNEEYESVNNFELIRYTGLIGLTAAELAESQNSPFTEWEHTTNMWGYDYFTDFTNDVLYLFVNDGEPQLTGQKMCWGFLMELGDCISLQSETADELLEELFNTFGITFEWIPDYDENSYLYSSKFENEGIAYYMAIYTDENKQFSKNSAFELILSAQQEQPTQ